MTAPDPDPETDMETTRQEPAVRPQRTSGVPARIVDPAPAWTQVATCALVVLVLEVAGATYLVVEKLQTIAEVLAIQKR